MDPSVHILAANAGSAVSNLSDTLPDDELNTRWESYAIDSANPSASAPESGNGVLDRLTITADSSATTGQYLVSLSANVHVDASGAAYFPHSTGVANIAVNQPCEATVTSYGYYHPLTPARILDTIMSGTITADVTGVGGVPNTSEVSAVVLNTTVDAPSSFSYLTVFPSGEPRPTASNLNFRPGQTVPNLVTVKVGADGNVQIYNDNGQARVIFDVVGWYGGPTGGSRFNPLTPSRILDTRTSPQGVPAGKVQSNSEITVAATGVGGVPPLASGVTAVVLNATVDAPTATSYLTIYPTGVTRPLASNLNFVKDQTVPNLVTVKVGAADGKVKVYNKNGQVHVIFDVVGWYGGTTGDVFNPLTPARVLDTRTSPQGVPPGKVQSNAEITVAATAVGGVPWPGVSSVIMNATVDQPTLTSYLTIYPADAPRPTASNLNFIGGQTVPNLVVVKVSAADGKVKAYNNNGQVDVIFDVVGFFGPVP
jgi:hypothetical protein